MRLTALCLAASALVLGACAPSETNNLAEAQAASRSPVLPQQSSDPYYRQAADAVAARAESRDVRPAKNVILFVGDGMGISTITAGRIYAGQKRGVDGESYQLAMDTLPQVALSKTYAHDGQVSDSASTATAMVSGVKSNVRTLGVTTEATFGNCASAQGNGTDTLFELAERAGLATGILSTARITHATPAATYAESPSRDWEDNTSFRTEEPPVDCPDIASQLVDWDAGDGFEIAMGGGRRHFLTTDMSDPELEDGTGRRTDGRDLAGEWTRKSNDHRVIYSQAGFDATNFDSDTKVLGLFEPSHLNYELDRSNDEMGEPSLAELTRAAITRLSRDEDGYVLMVEGGRIDHAHHGTNAARALEDTDAFDRAIAAALELTSAEDTLIIVTADHSHTMTIAGYQKRNNPILGLAVLGTGEPMRGADGMPYTTLSYANGGSACAGREGPEGPCVRADLSDIDTTESDYRQAALVPMFSETHAGEDVAIFARGPGSELVSGVMEQNEIFHVMGHASGLVARSE
ncbi:MAG: alkaline phosphatase [Pseudomonadota bacterium]